MAKTREELQEFLCGILGSRNAYFRGPESNKMSYPAIIYDLSAIATEYANDRLYKNMRAYELILIDYDPDSKLFDELLMIPYCSFDRPYTADNLNHWVFTLYF